MTGLCVCVGKSRPWPRKSIKCVVSGGNESLLKYIINKQNLNAKHLNYDSKPNIALKQSFAVIQNIVQQHIY